MKTIRLIIIAESLMLFSFSCSYEIDNRHKPEAAPCIDSGFSRQLDFTSAVSQRLIEEISLTGTVEPDPDKVVHFVSLASGMISNVTFSLGDKVVKGQVLAELRSTELSTLHAQLLAVSSQIDVAEKRLESARGMFDDGISSQKDLLEAESGLKVLRSEKQRISDDLRLFNASPSKNAFLIRSPGTGIVTAKFISGGSQISPDSGPLFTVADLDQVWVMVNVYATNVQNVEPGMDVDIKTLSFPDDVFRGRISAISQVYDEGAKVLKARVAMKNTEMKLKPGMPVDVKAFKYSNQEAIAIPADAIVFDDNMNFVLVYRNECDIEIRKIEVLYKNNGLAYVAQGLDEGENIITRHQLLVYEHIKNFQK